MHAIEAQIRTFCKAHPRQAIGILVGLGVLGALAIGASFWGTAQWQAYHLTGTVLTLELPAEPKTSQARLGGDISVLYQVSCQDVAVLAGGGAVPAGETPDARYIAEQAMDTIRGSQGVKQLKFQAGEELINGHPCLLVAGSFERDGVPSHLSGAFFLSKKAHAHVICLWSAQEGAVKASRILRSIQLQEPKEG